MILTSQATAPIRSYTEIALAGLAVGGVLASGAGGTYRRVLADLPYSAYSGQTFLLPRLLRLLDAHPAPFPATHALRLPAQLTGSPRIEVILASSTAASTRLVTKTTLASLSVNGTLPSGTFGHYRAANGVLWGPPLVPPGPLSLRVLNFSNSVPAAPPGYRNVRWQADNGTDPRNVSAMVPLAGISAPGLLALAGDIGGSATGPTIAGLQGVPLSAMNPSDGQVLTYSAAAAVWQPKAPSGGSATVGSFAILANGSTVASSGAGSFSLAVNGSTIALYS